MIHVCCRPMHIRKEHMRWCLEDLKAHGSCWWRDVRLPGDPGAPPETTTKGPVKVDGAAAVAAQQQQGAEKSAAGPPAAAPAVAAAPPDAKPVANPPV
jgi:hypothetical protein